MFNCVLGSNQIKKRLGKDIFIYPFKEENLKGCSYNLTASKLAYYADDKNIALNYKGEIVLPPNRTVLIQTEEVIYVRKNICATYHTKVSLACRGFSSISTTLDPNYFGGSLIALTNLSNKEQIIKSNKSIVTLIFYRVTGCNKEIKDNAQNRDDLMPQEFKDSQLDRNIHGKKRDEFLQDIDKIRDESWRKDYKQLIKLVRNEYKIKPINLQDIILFIIYILVIIISAIGTKKEIIDVSTLVTILVVVIPLLLNWFNQVYLRIRRD